MIENKQVWDKGLGPATGMIFNQGSAGSSQQMSPMTGGGSSATASSPMTGQADWNKYNVQKSATNYNPMALSGSTPANTSQTQTPATTTTPAKPVTQPSSGQSSNIAPKAKVNPYQSQIDRYQRELDAAMLLLNQYNQFGKHAVGGKNLSQIQMDVAKAQQKIMEFTNAGKKWM